MTRSTRKSLKGLGGTIDTDSVMAEVKNIRIGAALQFVGKKN